MRHTNVCAYLCWLLLAAAAGQPTLAAQVSSPTERSSSSAPRPLAAEILANEKAVWEAAKQRDVERFKQLVAPDARMIFTSGVRSRAEYIASIGSRQIESYTLDDFQVFTPAPNTAIAVYKATISGIFGNVKVPPTTVRESSVWIKRGNRWVAVLNQETPIQD